jgi:hypothetical protein
MIKKTQQEVEEDEKNLGFCHPSHSLSTGIDAFLRSFFVVPFPNGEIEMEQRKWGRKHMHMHTHKHLLLPSMAVLPFPFCWQQASIQCPAALLRLTIPSSCI